ncbi:cytochrome P450 [Xylaria cf. heliscus]|nr:cytochrome P450 [Xylaria cf. heliscus]
MDFLQTLVPAARGLTYVTITFCLVAWVYRLCLHPLSQYPGPLLAKLSDFYGAFYAANTTLHFKTLQDHETFGSVIRQGPNKLVFNTSTALYDIYQNERITKARVYLVSQRAPNAYGLFNSIDRSIHQRKRKLLGPVVNDRSTRAFEASMLGQIDVFIQGLLSSCQEQPTKPVDLTERFTYLATDIMGEFVFGYPLNLQTNETYRFMTDTTSSYFLNIALQLPFLSHIRISNLRPLRAFLRGKSYRSILQKMIRSRLAEGPDAKHNLFFMTDTLRVSDDDEVFIEEIRSEATFLLSAGSDTISTCLSALFFYLSRNADCYQKVTAEIRTKFSSSDSIRGGPCLSDCSYLRACIDESMRMSPPIAGTLWREQIVGSDADAGPLLIDGHIIPPGTHVGVNIYALHHNEEYFPEPFTFKPERFLSGDVQGGEQSRKAFAPFSLGARGCMGRSMAYLELSLIAAKILWHFDVTRTPDEAGRLGESVYWKLRGRRERINEYQTNDIFGAIHHGPYLLFKPREEGSTAST